MKPEKRFFERYVKGFCFWQVLVLTVMIILAVFLQMMIFPDRRINAVYLYYSAGYFFFFGLLGYMGYAFLRSSKLTKGSVEVLRRRFMTIAVVFTVLAYLLFVLVKANDPGLFRFILVLFGLAEVFFCVEFLKRLTRKNGQQEEDV